MIFDILLYRFLWVAAMTKISIHFFLVLLMFFFMALFPVSFTQASQQKTSYYTFDKLHTQIHFSISHLGFSYSHGRFMDFNGGFYFDKEKPEESFVDITINTASIFMGSKEWDDHLKNADFFDVEKHPVMHFKSTKVEVTGDKTANIYGDLTLLGLTKPVILQTRLNGFGLHPYSKKNTAGFSATTTIKRSDFGMTYGLPAVGDEVSIVIEVEAQQSEAEDSPL